MVVARKQKQPRSTRKKATEVHGTRPCDSVAGFREFRGCFLKWPSRSLAQRATTTDPSETEPPAASRDCRDSLVRDCWPTRSERRRVPSPTRSTHTLAFRRRAPSPRRTCGQRRRSRTRRLGHPASDNEAPIGIREVDDDRVAEHAVRLIRRSRRDDGRPYTGFERDTREPFADVQPYCADGCRSDHRRRW
jgi:hypothetical protein